MKQGLSWESVLCEGSRKAIQETPGEHNHTPTLQLVGVEAKLVTPSCDQGDFIHVTA